ncbi:MAG: DPP IV N-terminal domain-containing protein, partial [Acidobacteriota bacterium]
MSAGAAPAALAGLVLAASAIVVPLAVAEAPPAGQTLTDGELGLELIMSDPMWIGATPFDPYWSLDGLSIYYERNRPDSDGDRELLRLPLDGPSDRDGGGDGNGVPIAGADWADVDAAEVTYNPDRTAAVFTRHGDVFRRDLKTGELRQLTRTASRESNPFFTRAGDVAFERGGHFFIRTDEGLEWQPAAIQEGEDPGDDKSGEDYLSQQQPRLFEVITERQRRRGAERERRETRLIEDPTAPPRTFYLGDDVEVMGRFLSPDARSMAVVTAPEKREEGRDDKMPEWVTEDGYVNIRDVRNKVGTDGDWTHSLVLLDAGEHIRFDVDLSGLPGIADDPLADLRAAAEERRSAAEEREAVDPESAGDSNEAGEGRPADAETEDDAEPRSVRIFDLKWSPDGARAAFQVHSTDNKDRWLVVVEPTEASAAAPVTVHRLSLEGWINWNFNEFDWLDASRLWFLSEATGYSHLYLHDVVGGETRQLTEGDRERRVG